MLGARDCQRGLILDADRPTVGDLREPLELPVACTLKIVSATPGKQTFVLNELNWGGEARLTDGQSALTTNKADGFMCPDGSMAPTVDTYKFDNVTLTGTHTSFHNAVCGTPAGMAKPPFTLAFAKPFADPHRPLPVGVRTRRQSPVQVTTAIR